MTDAERIKELEARVAELEDLAGRLQVEMSDWLTHLNEKYPHEFVWSPPLAARGGQE